MKQFVSQTIKGEKPLWFTFWIIFFLPILIGPMIYVPLLVKLRPDVLPGNFEILMMITGLGYFFYSIIAIIGSWRSASNYKGPKFWAYFAKFFLGLIIIFSCWSFLANFATELTAQ